MSEGSELRITASINKTEVDVFFDKVFNNFRGTPEILKKLLPPENLKDAAFRLLENMQLNVRKISKSGILYEGMKDRVDKMPYGYDLVFYNMAEDVYGNVYAAAVHQGANIKKRVAVPIWDKSTAPYISFKGAMRGFRGQAMRARDYMKLHMKGSEYPAFTLKDSKGRIFIAQRRYKMPQGTMEHSKKSTAEQRRRRQSILYTYRILPEGAKISARPFITSVLKHKGNIENFANYLLNILTGKVYQHLIAFSPRIYATGKKGEFK